MPFLASPLALAIKLTLFESASASSMIMVGSFLLILVLFAFPLLLLGMVSPYVIKLYTNSTEHLGEQAGSIFALSTIGSILGTFLPTLWLIPTIGTRWTILVFAFVLVLTAGVGLYKHKRYIFIVTAFVLFGYLSVFEIASAQSIYRGESAYQYIDVIDIKDQRLLVFNEGLGVQSMYSPDKIFFGFYYDYYSPLPRLFEKERVDIGILGLAGGTLSRAFSIIYGDGVAIDGVEIDQKVIDVAREYFELDQPQLTVINQDARIFVERADNAYDLLIVDAYSQQLYIPWTMTTQEFWQDAERAIRSDGIVALNINATTSDAPLLSAVSNTITSVFDHVYIVPLTQDSSWNYLILASNRAVDLTTLSDMDLASPLDEYADVLESNVSEIFFKPDELVLTDDRAPVELMTEEMIINFYFDN